MIMTLPLLLIIITIIKIKIKKNKKTKYHQVLFQVHQHPYADEDRFVLQVQ